jgi:hypothetical protein
MALTDLVKGWLGGQQTHAAAPPQPEQKVAPRVAPPPRPPVDHRDSVEAKRRGGWTADYGKPTPPSWR